MEPFVQQSLLAVYNLELTWLWRYKWYPTNVSHHGWTVDRTRNKDHDSLQRSLNQKNLVKFCLSCDLKIHKVTPFRSLEVRIDDLISRKMDIWYADHNYLLIYTNSVPMDYNYETWQARLWRHTILVDPSPISSEIGELSDFKPRNLPI